MSTHGSLDLSDLGLVSALSCLGYAIDSLDRSDPRRVVFSLRKDQKGLDDAVKAYWDGSMRLPPASLFTHQKLLKQRLYAAS